MEWTELVGIFTTGVVSPLVVQWIRNKEQRRRAAKKDSVAEEVRFSKIISHRLEDIKDKFDADRVWISQFHNGGHYYPTGRSIQKFSIFHEVVSYDTPPIKMSFQNIPVTLFAKSTMHIYEHNYLAIPDYFAEDANDYGLRFIAEETGAKSYYGFAIFCIENKFIGSLGVEYLKDKRDLTPEEIKEIEIEAAMLGGVMINYLKGH